MSETRVRDTPDTVSKITIVSLSPDTKFCLYAERDIWKPYEKHHSTVKDACELAESLGIPNLVLWHTEDSNVAGRERLYKSEGKRYYSGNIYVPDDESLIAL